MGTSLGSLPTANSKSSPLLTTYLPFQGRRYHPDYQCLKTLIRPLLLPPLKGFGKGPEAPKQKPQSLFQDEMGSARLKNAPRPSLLASPPPLFDAPAGLSQAFDPARTR